MNKLQVQFKTGCDDLYQALGIPEDRAEELTYRMKCIIHEVTRPTKGNEEGPTSDVMLKMFIALAENQQELIMCSYMAGFKTPDVFDLYDLDEEDFDE